MSEFHVRRVVIDNIRPHPNADRLEIVMLDMYPCIVAKGSFNVGDTAIYIPIDSIVECKRPEFMFLATSNYSQEDIEAGKRHETIRIKAKRLRGSFSMGLLIPDNSSYTTLEKLGSSLQEILGITKYEPPIDVSTGGNNCKVDFVVDGVTVDVPKYTDIEGYRRYPNIFEDGEEVAITEKIHGCNGRFMVLDGKLYVASMNFWKELDDSNVWAKVAAKLNLADRLKNKDGFVFFGEVYGRVQDLHYGKDNDVGLRFFDVYDTRTGKYCDWAEFIQHVTDIVYDTEDVRDFIVPVLYVGPWDNSLTDMSEGKSTLADHVREGFVVKPTTEKFCKELGGRKILKVIGEGYLLRKNA